MVEVATRVLIAGGGVAALEAALALRELGEGRVSVEMLAPEPEFWYRPLEEIVAGQVGRVAFVVPWGAVWSLPIYELALMTAAYLAERDVHVELALVTPEEAPLQLFGRAGSEAVRQLLEERGIALQTGF